MIEAVGTEVGDINVYVTVVVNIGSCAADTVADVADTRCICHIGERSIAVVAIERVSVFG